MIKKYISGILLCSLMTMNVAFATTNFNYTNNAQSPQYESNYYNNSSNSQPLKGHIVTVPAGETMPVVSTCDISSATAYTGQNFCTTLGSDLYYNGTIIAPAGSNVIGTVIQVSKAKRGTINGRMCIRFNQIVTPSGYQIPISAVVKTDDHSGMLIGGTKLDSTKHYAKQAAVGAAAGALSGLVFGALAGGSIGRGAALGTAVGAGAGLVKSGVDKGADVEIPAGSSFDIELTQPITVSPSH